MSDCLFCQIIRGERAAHVVAETPSTLAFLDIHPLFPGHVLLVPKQHVVTLADVATDLIGPLFMEAQHLSRAVEQAMEAKGTFVAMNNKVSQSVPHLHIHVAPRKPKDGLRGFFWPRVKYESDSQMRDVAETIKAVSDSLR